MVFGVTDAYKIDNYNIKNIIEGYYYLVYPIGMNIFPIPYWLFPIGIPHCYSLLVFPMAWAASSV